MQPPEVRCGTCPAWRRLHGPTGECRGKTPEVIVLPAPPRTQSIVPVERPKEDGMTRDFQIRSVFPPMAEDGYCGKHPKFDWNAPVADEPLATAVFGGRA